MFPSIILVVLKKALCAITILETPNQAQIIAGRMGMYGKYGFLCFIDMLFSDGQGFFLALAVVG